MNVPPETRFDLNLLRVFDALMAERSVTRAAARLGLTQSSTSNALDRLRKALGDRVLERHGNAMVPTRLAQDIWPDIAAALGRIEAALAAPGGFDPASLMAEVTLGIDEYALALLGPRLLADLERSAPGLRLRLVAAWPRDDSEALFEGRMDLIVGPVWQRFPGLKVEPLLAEDFIGVADPAHPLATGRPTVEAYVAHPHLIFSQRGIVAGNVDAGLAQLGLGRRVVAALPYLSLAPEFLRGTDRVLAIGRRLGTRLAAQAGLGRFELPVRAPDFRLAMFWHPRNDASPSHVWLRGRVAAACPD